MKKDENCVFCKIVTQEIPSFKVYEDENFYGFLTIKPHTKGHTLLIPKNHFEEILVTDDEVVEKIFLTGKNLAQKIKNIFNPDKVAFMVAGQGVPHLHLHLIPMNHESDLDPHIAKDAEFGELAEIQKLFN
jgi:histidine triad (HIT) family protein